VQLIKFTLCRGPTVQTEMSLFNDRWNSLYDKSASFRCDEGPATENALSKVLYICTLALYLHITRHSHPPSDCQHLKFSISADIVLF